MDDTKRFWGRIGETSLPPDINGYIMWPSPHVKAEHGLDMNLRVGCVPNDPRLPDMQPHEFLMTVDGREWRCRETG